MSAPTPAPIPTPERKPLSMLWVLAAVACFVVVHTLVNVGYRKPDHPHEPAAEARERQHHFVQADLKGWTRFAAHLTPPTSTIAAPAAITREPAPENLAAALPFELVGIFTKDPKLHAGPMAIVAAVTLPDDGTLRIQLRFDTAGAIAFGEALAFAKDHHLYLFLQDETRTVLDESPTPFAPALELSLPPGVLPAGDWTVSLYAKDAAFSWQFSVQDSAAP